MIVVIETKKIHILVRGQKKKDLHRILYIKIPISILICFLIQCILDILATIQTKIKQPAAVQVNSEVSLMVSVNTYLNLYIFNILLILVLLQHLITTYPTLLDVSCHTLSEYAQHELLIHPSSFSETLVASIYLS